MYDVYFFDIVNLVSFDPDIKDKQVIYSRS